jgi:hypothetical protein
MEKNVIKIQSFDDQYWFIKVSEEQSISIQKILENFKYRENISNDIFYQEKVFIKKEEIPVPNFVKYLFRDVMGFQWGQHFEKIHWNIIFAYKDIDIGISLEKFGMRIYGIKKEESHEIIRLINKAIKYLEKHILPNYVKTQFEHNNIMISNHFNDLSHMYNYFRENANTIFNKEKNLSNSLAKNINDYSNKNHKGYYNSFAMIEAYFSRFEHFLVFCLFFNTDRSLNIKQFTKKNFSDKLKFIFPTSTKNNEKYYQKIQNIKEKYRNTFSHGMFSKAGEPFFIECSSIGNFPITLTQYKDSPHFNFTPIQKFQYDEIIKELDGIDEWLTSESAKFAWAYAKSGLPLGFSELSVTQIQPYLDDIEKFEQYLEIENEKVINNLNVDF